jgi:hypothetical protein
MNSSEERDGVIAFFSNVYAASIISKGIAMKTPEESLSICLAASLDLINDIYTIANLPEDSKRKADSVHQ